MRFRSLRLAPYGPFENLCLEFQERTGLHLVYGTNGAGKSTTLEALRSVLFGMTAGARSFRFDSSTLRLGAHLVRANGESLSFMRRTASKVPLWSENDQTPLAEERLAPFLGNFDREQFETLFGLDLETMVAGGEDLLKGEGDIGRALFGAGLGGQRLARIVERLDEEVRGLYVERSAKGRVNELIAEHREVLAAQRKASLSASAFEDDRRELARERKAMADAQGEQRELRREFAALQRLLRALAPLRPLETKRQERAALGEFVPLDAESSHSAGRLAEERVRLVRHDEERAQRLADHAHSCVPRREEARPDLLANASMVDALGQRRSAFRDAGTDLAQGRIELEEVRARRDEALGRAGTEDRGAGRDDTARVSAPAESSLAVPSAAGTGEELAEAADGHIKRMDGAATEVERCAKEAKRAEALARRAREAVDIQSTEYADLFADELRDLEPFRGDLDELRALRVPAESAIDECRKRSEALAQKRAEVQVRATTARADEREALQGLALLAASTEGTPPTRGELLAARSARDEVVRSAFDAAPTPLVALSVERAVHAADDLADRLAAQSTRAVMRVNFDAEVLRARSEAGPLESETAALDAQLAETEVGWRALWSEAGFSPLTPTGMAVWCERRHVLLQRLSDLREKARADLCKQEEARDLRAADLYAATESQAKAESAWVAWALAQQLDPSAGAEAARRRLRSLVEVRAAEGLVSRASAFVEQKSRFLAAFVEDVAKLCDQLQIRVSEQTLEQALKADIADVALTEARMIMLIESVERAKRAESRLAAVERLIENEAEGARSAQVSLVEIERALERHAGEAGAASVSELIERADRSDRARALDDDLRQLGRAFEENSAGRTPEEIRAEVRERGVPDLEAEATALQRRLDVVEENSRARALAVDQLAARVEGKGSENAAHLEARLAEFEAELEEATLSLLTALIAQRLLEREVDRYRQATQGPLLARAQELFGVLTLGAYTQLHPSEEKGKPVMVARRPDGRTVHVEGMSTGTRDQLYLALRIASVEHMLKMQEPMPFIADDLFVNFDDERTEAALRVLADLGKATQVIVFTHHASVVATAERLTQDGVAVDVVKLAGERECSELVT
ncbi:MAG: AAA family ATPase [Planctomycetota bacterium]|nr:AAA family ATPase [Planctomycetota bacterium]